MVHPAPSTIMRESREVLARAPGRTRLLAGLWICTLFGCVDARPFRLLEFQNPRGLVIHSCADSKRVAATSVEFPVDEYTRILAASVSRQDAIAVAWDDGTLRIYSAALREVGRKRCGHLKALSWSNAGDKLAGLYREAIDDSHTYRLVVMTDDLEPTHEYAIDAPMGRSLCFGLSWSADDSRIAVSTDLFSEPGPPYCAVVNMHNGSIRTRELSNVYYVGGDTAVANLRGRRGAVYIVELSDTDVRRVRWIAGAWFCQASHPPSGAFVFRHWHMHTWPLVTWWPVSMGSGSGGIPVRIPAKPSTNSILCLGKTTGE